jgi:hypothetical protein
MSPEPDWWNSVKNYMKTVLYHSNQLGYRGTEISLYTYAKYNEEILGNRSIIVSDKHASHGLEAYEKFNSRFPTYLYDHFSEVQSIADKERVDVFYAQKSGQYDGKLLSGVKNSIHAVFRYKQPHGEAYAYISEWLANHMSQGELPFVPYIVEKLPTNNLNLRTELGIPNDALVFGYHGGRDSFNIPFVKDVVRELAGGNVYFLFMNIDKFHDHPNVIHIPGTYDLIKKCMFIDTCDASLQARDGGETFGLSVAEYSSQNKPVITYTDVPEKAHIEMLGDVGMYYSNHEQLINTLLNFRDLKRDINYDVYTEKYSPTNVMKKFQEVFLK